jgi:aminoglycoside/choline kinase family phosphotransferase
MSDAGLQNVRLYLDRSGLAGARIVPLTGDASDRRYFRIIQPARPPHVVALYAQPFAYDTLPFVNVSALFARLPAPIPAILGQAADLGVLALQDLGDVTLQAHLGAAPASEHLARYRAAVELISLVQARGRALEDPRYLPYGVAFDVEKLMWEFDFFVKHFLGAYRGIEFTLAEREALRAECLAIAETLAAEPRVLCHRDYHSRNLMLSGGELYMIDYQDARMGPDTYDLASLIRDSYVDIPEAMVEELIAYYLAVTGRRRETAFRDRLDMMSLQRNLKALGTFGYQTTARRNPVYIQYMPRTLRYARENLAKYARFARLRDLLAAHVEEFR